MAAPVSVRSSGIAASVNLILRAFEVARSRLPKGGALPEEAWQGRHRGVLTVLWLHVPGIVLFGLAVGHEWSHLIFEIAPIALAAVGAGYLSDRRIPSTVLASAGLVTASAVIVHLSGGVIEAHFHFFVMVGVVVLYQEWWPFLVAIGYVVVHHGTVGTLASHSVYNHPAAVNSPWTWAAIHGGFILAMSTAGIVGWRLNESLRMAVAVSEQHLAEAQQLARLGSWEFDLRTENLVASDELDRMFGLSGTDEPTFTSFVERIHPDDRERLLRAMMEAREAGSGFALDFRVVRGSGEIGWLHGRGQAVMDETGTPGKMRGTVQDITERKEFEAALARESAIRQLLETVAEAANEAETVQAATEVALEQVCRFTGWPVGHAFASGAEGQALVRTGAWYLSDPDRFERFRRETEETVLEVGAGLAVRVWKTAAPVWVPDLSTDPSFTRREPAGRAGLCSAVAFPILAGQDVAGVLEFFSTRPEPVDHELLEVMARVGKQLALVLERTRATEALQASEERKRTIVETASDAFVGMDEHGAIVDWNHQAELMFGWPREEVLGRQVAETIVPEELREAYVTGLRLRTGISAVVSRPLSIEAHRRDGTRFPVELTVWEVRSPQARYFNAFLRDITRQKEVEEALASARDHALEASRLKSEFLANVSHEIRTPMNGVIGLTQLLSDTPLDATQRRYAEGIESAGEALLGLIDDLLDLSKAEAGRIELEQVDFGLRELVEESTHLLAGAAEAKGLELVASCDPHLPALVQSDRGRLRQVLINLVGNAVKFTTRGEVVVRAELQQARADYVTVRVEVADTGVGIDPASHARIFEPFTQADSSTTRQFGGTGLGLALSKRLVELMGGQIGVESEVGVGSTFWFTVGLGTQAGPPSDGPSLDAEWLVGARILVVDDNATSCRVLREQLCQWGVRADAARAPHDALDLARNAAGMGQPYEIALVDLQMPEMTGLEVADRLSREPAFGGPSVILLGSARLLSEAHRTPNGRRLALIKPVRQAELLDALRLALGVDGTPVLRVESDAAPSEQALARRGHVLVAEDNALNRTVALGSLRKLGYRVDVATNGREAVQAASRHAYSAVLMDCQMPEMDGYQATREIREREAGRRHVPIIAMTASAMEGDRDRCLAAGMDDYIAKPVRAEALDAALRRWTGQQSAPARDSSGDGDDVLDLSQLEELRALAYGAGNPDRFRELVAEFLEQARTRQAELGEAARRRDWHAVARAAHALAGNSALVGAARVASASTDVEVAANSGDVLKIAERLQALERELDLAMGALELEAPSGALDRDQ